MSDKPAFEKVYSKPGIAIWTEEDPPQKLIDFVERGRLKPGSSILDCACGEGAYSVYLSKHGFEVLGIDFSEKAIQYARDRAEKEGSAARFEVLDALQVDSLKRKFDFVFEWAFIHHIRFEDVEPYVTKVAGLLDPGGYYLSLSFNSDHPDYAQRGQKVFKTHLGTELRYHTLQEMRDIFSKHFEVVEEELIRVDGKGVWHPGNYFLLRKK